MLSIDATDFNKSLQEYKEQLEKHLESAVKQMALGIVQDLIRKTPYGNSAIFGPFYDMRRMEDPRYPASEGMTRANWNITVDNYAPSVAYVDGTRQGENSIARSTRGIASYKVGETIYIHNATPYIGMINSQQSPGGVRNHISQAIEAIYLNNAKFVDYLNNK